MIFIGIDCGVQTGFAMWDGKQQGWIDLPHKLQPMLTIDFWEALEIVEKSAERLGRKICCKVEDPSGNAPVFQGKLTGHNKRKQLKIAQNIGMNKREAQLMIEGLGRIDGVLVDPITPKQSKLDAKTFKTIAGYKGSTSQHARDAAMLVLGLRPIPKAQWEILIKQQEEK